MAASTRIVVRTGLIGAGILSLVVIVLPLVQLGASRPESWAAVAGALAVLTAIVSAWTSQRVLELQEDAQEPAITLSLDTRLRSQLVQLRVANVGGSLAKDVEVTWDRPLLNVKGDPVRLSSVPEGPDIIPVLMPGQSTAVLVGVAHRFFDLYKNTTNSGTIRYKNASDVTRKQRFVVSAEVHRQSLVHENEEAITHEKLQKIPERLEEIASELARLREALAPSEVGVDDEDEIVDKPPNSGPEADT
jgi:hypothetical protein